MKTVPVKVRDITNSSHAVIISKLITEYDLSSDYQENYEKLCSFNKNSAQKRKQFRNMTSDSFHMAKLRDQGQQS